VVLLTDTTEAIIIHLSRVVSLLIPTTGTTIQILRVQPLKGTQKNLPLRGGVGIRILLLLEKAEVLVQVIVPQGLKTLSV